MDSKRPRTISDIRPARSMDGVTPVGPRQPSAVPRQQPAAVEPPKVQDNFGSQTPTPESENIPKPSPAVAIPSAPVPAQTPVANVKPKGSRLKVLIKIIFTLILLGLLSVAGWVVYSNYFV